MCSSMFRVGASTIALCKLYNILHAFSASNIAAPYCSESPNGSILCIFFVNIVKMSVVKMSIISDKYIYSQQSYLECLKNYLDVVKDVCIYWNGTEYPKNADFFCSLWS